MDSPQKPDITKLPQSLIDSTAGAQTTFKESQGRETLRHHKHKTLTQFSSGSRLLLLGGLAERDSDRGARAVMLEASRVNAVPSDVRANIRPNSWLTNIINTGRGGVKTKNKQSQQQQFAGSQIILSNSYQMTQIKLKLGFYYNENHRDVNNRSDGC